MDNYLIQQIKKLQGNVLGIGNFNEKVKKAIEDNKSIEECFLLEETSKKLTKNKLRFFNRKRKVNIKKLRKTFKKKSIDTTIANYKTIIEFQKWFVRESIYITHEKIYIYGEKIELEDLIKKYKRYTKNIELKEENDEFVLEINCENTKTNKLKDIGYWWVDTATSFIDFLTLILAN